MQKVCGSVSMAWDYDYIPYHGCVGLKERGGKPRRIIEACGEAYKVIESHCRTIGSSLGTPGGHQRTIRGHFDTG